ncbi:hypothetical protein D3C87_1708050 [compost metagenome]
MCGDCDDLRQDIRRYTPHAELARDGVNEPPRPHGAAECRYRCGTCATQWVRRVPPFEPFAVWAVVPARHAAPLYR